MVDEHYGHAIYVAIVYPQPSKEDDLEFLNCLLMHAYYTCVLTASA